MRQPIFAFGPTNRYFLSDGQRKWTNDLPESLNYKLEGLSDTINTTVDPSSCPSWICCAFGARDSYLLAFKQRGSFHIYHEDLPPKLEAWLFDPKTGAQLRDISSLKVTIGKYDSFFATDKNGFRWDMLPEGLEEYIQAGLRPEGGSLSDLPRLVALGSNPDFVLVTSKGALHAFWDSELVSKLEKVGGSPALISFMSVNPHDDDEFFLTLKDQEDPLYYIAETKKELIADTKELVSILSESFRVERNHVPMQASQSINRQFASLSV